MSYPEQDPNQQYDPYGSPYGNGQYNAGQYGGAQYGGQYGQPPSYPGQPYPAAGQYPGYPVPNGEMQDPDNAMGIVGLVLNFVCCGPIGLVVSWIALNKSKQRGYKNTVALIGAIIGGVSTVIGLGGLIFWLFFVVLFAASTPTAPSELLTLF